MKQIKTTPLWKVLYSLTDVQKVMIIESLNKAITYYEDKIKVAENIIQSIKQSIKNETDINESSIK